MSAVFSKKWYVVRCKPRQEIIARTHLERQDYRILLPYVTRVMGQRKLEVMFPGYLFIEHADAEQSLAPVRSTRGCIGLVRFGPWPAEVPDAIIESLARHDGAEAPLVVDDLAGLKSGDTVQMSGEAFAGMKAIFLEADAQQRVRVLLEILGQRREIRVPLTAVQRVS